MHKKEKVKLYNFCLIYKDDRVLVLDRLKDDWPGITFPGGHIELNEDITSSVIREVKEETGLTIINPTLCGLEEYKNDKTYDRYLVFMFKANKFKGRLKPSNEGKVYWMDINDFKKAKKSLDMDILYKVMISAKLNELVYYKEDKKRKKKVV